MQETTTSSSLESPTMIHATGREATMAIIEELNLKACRLRSLNEFNLGETVSFDVTLRGAPKLEVTGRIMSAAQNGVRRSYTVAFDDLDGRQSDRIAVALDMAKRFSASHHVDQPTASALTRASRRVPVDLPIRYLSDVAGSGNGRATNLSTGGMLMNADADGIPVGSSLELRFKLAQNEREVAVHARVVAHQQQSPQYNIAFHNVPPDVHTFLERFIAGGGGYEK